jgi:AcrR family transcriptional regulator
MVDDDIRRMAKVLEAVVKLSDFSTRELERRLELGGGTLNRLFSGKIDLKLRHVLLVLDVVGMKPERFFQLACARPPAEDEGEAASLLAAEILESFQRFGYSIGRPGQPLPASNRPLSTLSPIALSDDELDRRIEAALERVMGKASREPAATTAPAVAATGEALSSRPGQRGPEIVDHE